MTIQDLKIIDKIAAAGSISHAAEELYMQQTTVSAVLKRVETDLGFALFDRRHGKQAQLTPKGSEAMAIIHTLLQNFQSLKKIGKQENYLRIGIPPQLSKHLISVIHAEDPDAIETVHYVEDDYDSLEKFVLNGEIDMAIVSGPLKTTEPLFHEIVCRAPLGITLSREADERLKRVSAQTAGERMLRISDIMDLPLVLPANDSRAGKVLMHNLDQSAVRLTDFRPVSGAGQRLQMAESGEFNVIGAVSFDVERPRHYTIRDFSLPLTFLLIGSPRISKALFRQSVQDLREFFLLHPIRA